MAPPHLAHNDRVREVEEVFAEDARWFDGRRPTEGRDELGQGLGADLLFLLLRFIVNDPLGLRFLGTGGGCRGLVHGQPTGEGNNAICACINRNIINGANDVEHKIINNIIIIIIAITSVLL